MKNIDADLLRKEIERLKGELMYGSCSALIQVETNCKNEAYNEILSCIDSLQQEQPEVDLEKFTEKIDNYKARYKYPESVSVKGAMAFMARMFYQYPNTARQWYEKLPKVTMD